MELKEEHQQDGIQVQLDKGQVLQHLFVSVQSELGREEGGRDADAFRLGLKAGEEHPHKGENHNEGTHDQGEIGEESADNILAVQ